MNFLFTCGGTAGHVNPAIAVAGRLRELMPDCGILFIGAEGMMEMKLVPREGYDIQPLHITNISRGRDLKALEHNIDTLKNVAVSLHEAKKIIKDFAPDVVIGTGGYVCYPVLCAASQLNIPTVVHESNAVPGLTTKLLEKRVDRILVGFEESRKNYKHPDKVLVTGTPVRGAFGSYTQSEAKAELGLTKDEPLVVSVWGSLGAGYMNDVLSEMIPMIAKKDFHLIHVTGSKYYEKIASKLRETAPDAADKGVEVREYLYDMPRVMAAADLILCRAGASTISELTYMGKPVIMIPSPNVTNNHQERNARVLERAGGAEVMLEGSFTPETLLSKINDLLADRERLSSMSEAMRSLAVPDACERICALILELAERK